MPSVESRQAGQVVQRRFVAVSVSLLELLRPESDLVRLLEGVGPVDLLVACDDVPVPDPAPLGVLGDGDGVLVDDLDTDDDEDPGEVLRSRVAELVLPGLVVHRLGLRPPLGPAAEGDLVAALSELVGFDPDPGVFLLGPAAAGAEAGGTVVDRAVHRIAQVYGIPLLRYRCHELTVVDPFTRADTKGRASPRVGPPRV
ncbi:MAG: hypothetical protein L0I24_07675 [Pseudonocardia sp.]|nr:hypothetical protein [Pseudonocardia sp.]